MCKVCQEALEKYFPNLPQCDRYDILMNLTAFPFADGEYTANQVAEVARACRVVSRLDEGRHGAESAD